MQRVYGFGVPGPLRDRLTAAVLRGEKTATSSLAEWEVDGEPLPSPGERDAMIDSDGNVVGELEILGVEVIRLGDADLQFAIDESEGYESVAQWRETHEDYWNTYVLPELPADRAHPLTDDTRIVVERFRFIGGESG